jgi:hypothetical protein
LPTRAGATNVFTPKAHLPTSAPFRVRAAARIRPVMHGTGEGPVVAVVSRCLSAAGIRFLGIRFPPRDSAFLTVGLPSTSARTTTGLPRSACMRPSRGGCRLCPGATVFSRPAKCLRSPPAASQRPALHPGEATIHPRLTLTRRHQSVCSRSPVRPSPRL